MGRSPDHVASFFSGYAAVPSVFAAGGQKYADNVDRVLRAHARRASLPQLRDRAAADRPQQAGAQAERSDALCRRGEGARRRHRDLRRAAACDRRPAVGLDPPELHPSAAAGRRELRQLRRHSGRRAGREALSAPAVRAARRQLVRLSAVEPVRRVRRLRGVRQRVRAVGARLHLPQHRASAATSGGRPPRTRSATIRRRCATSPSCAS